MSAVAAGAKRYSCFTNSKPPSFRLFPFPKFFGIGAASPIRLPRLHAAAPTNVANFTLCRYAKIKLMLMGLPPTAYMIHTEVYR
jgi:hypothetical protein